MTTRDGVAGSAYHKHGEPISRLGVVAQFQILVIPAYHKHGEPISRLAFLEALQLFASAFDSSGGFRLKIARPPILFYGLYGNTGMDDADRRLVDIITRRGLLADALDCLAACDCDDERRVCQVLLDKVLCDLDRAIDLYALGFQNFCQTERRAAAYGFLIDVVRTSPRCNNVLTAPIQQSLQALADDDLRPLLQVASDDRLRIVAERLLERAQAELQLMQGWPPFRPSSGNSSSRASRSASPNCSRVPPTGRGRRLSGPDRRPKTRGAGLKGCPPARGLTSASARRGYTASPPSSRRGIFPSPRHPRPRAR